MFKEVKNNKVFLALLGGASLLIWGIIAWQVIWGVRFEDDIPVQTPILREPLQPAAADADSFLTRLTGLRNPFQPYAPPQKTQKRPAQTVAVQPPASKETSPSMRYVGYLKDPSGSLAVLENGAGETQICKEGDMVAGMRLLRIEKSQVTLAQEKENREITLRR